MYPIPLYSAFSFLPPIPNILLTGEKQESCIIYFYGRKAWYGVSVY